MRHTLARVATALLGLCLTLAQAAPFTPAADSEIVQKLPLRLDAAARAQRAALAREPRHLPLALATARTALDRARRNGDPRELGLAQAALAPWWSLAEPPPAVRLLRATVLQSQHQFDAALADLDGLVRNPDTPLAVQAQAGLTRATVLQLSGRLVDAQAACQILLETRFSALGPALSVPARACAAELKSLMGSPRQAAADMAELARTAPRDPWLSLLRAELAQRMGDDAAAQARFDEIVHVDADVYVRAAYADWLLDRGRNRDALAAVLPDRDADALLLRRAIALKRLGDPQAAAATTTLAARLDAARERGQNLHAREQARLALDLLGQPERALALALENWSQQKEPADAVLLWRAAQAAGRPAAAAALRQWVADPARIDVRLSQPLPGGRT